MKAPANRGSTSFMTAAGADSVKKHKRRIVWLSLQLWIFSPVSASITASTGYSGAIPPPPMRPPVPKRAALLKNETSDVLAPPPLPPRPIISDGNEGNTASRTRDAQVQTEWSLLQSSNAHDTSEQPLPSRPLPPPTHKDDQQQQIPPPPPLPRQSQEVPPPPLRGEKSSQKAAVVISEPDPRIQADDPPPPPPPQRPFVPKPRPAEVANATIADDVPPGPPPIPPRKDTASVPLRSDVKEASIMSSSDAPDSKVLPQHAAKADLPPNPPPLRKDAASDPSRSAPKVDSISVSGSAVKVPPPQHQQQHSTRAVIPPPPLPANRFQSSTTKGNLLDSAGSSYEGIPPRHMTATRPSAASRLRHDPPQTHHTTSPQSVPPASSSTRYSLRSPPTAATHERPIAAQASSLLTFSRRLWGTVERGLDQLADWEDQVGGKASSLWQSARAQGAVGRSVPARQHQQQQQGQSANREESSRPYQRGNNPASTPRLSVSMLPQFSKRLPANQASSEPIREGPCTPYPRQQQQRGNTATSPQLSVSMVPEFSKRLPVAHASREPIREGPATPYPRQQPAARRNPFAGPASQQPLTFTNVSSQTGAPWGQTARLRTKPILIGGALPQNPGGASADGEETTPPSTGASRVPPQATGNGTGPGLRQFGPPVPPGVSSPGLQQHPQQQSQPPPPRRQALTSTWNPGPALPRPQAGSKQQLPPLFDGDDDREDDEGRSLLARLTSFLPPIPRFRMPSLRFRGRDPSLDFSTTMDAWQAQKEEEEELSSRGRSGLFFFRSRRRNQPPNKGDSSDFPVKPSSAAGVFSPTLSEFLDRCGMEHSEGSDPTAAEVSKPTSKTMPLLTPKETVEAMAMGRKRAVLDALQLLSMFLALKQVFPILVEALQQQHAPSGASDAWLETALTVTSQVIVPAISTTISTAIHDSWAPFFLAAALLCVRTKTLLLGSAARVKDALLAKSIMSAVQEQARYAGLFLQFLTTASQRHALFFNTPDLFASAVLSQLSNTIRLAQLDAFVSNVLAAIVLTTVLSPSVALKLSDRLAQIMWFHAIVPLCLLFQHFIQAVASLSWPPSVNFRQIISLDDALDFELWRSRWTAWSQDASTMAKHAVSSIMEALQTILQRVDARQVAFRATVVFAMVAAAFVPRLELLRQQRDISSPESATTSVAPNLDEEEVNEEQEAMESYQRLTQLVSDLSSQSATRLGVLAHPGALESLLERWRATMPATATISAEPSPPTRVMAKFRMAALMLMSALILLVPVAVVCVLTGRLPPFSWETLANNDGSLISWNSLLDLSVVLWFVQRHVNKASVAAVLCTEARRPIRDFCNRVVAAAQEALPSPKLDSSGRDTLLLTHQQQAMATASQSSQGLAVRDLWAAHATRRAWAVRGANLQCGPGEILLVLGDPGAGKSRLLTTLSEAMIIGNTKTQAAVLPPSSRYKRALSATRVRGSISLGGQAVEKIPPTALKKRVGLWLNNVQGVADMAKLFSGMTIEEILEPTALEGTGAGTASAPSRPSMGSERAALRLALQISGLGNSLLSKLPSKLTTVVTAHEPDLVPSALRPRYHLLSAAEWGQLLLARVLAQTIFDSENNHNNNPDSCLLGSLLLLDDVVTAFGEVEEARLLQQLRQTGASTVLTSNRWASGRFADRIVVVKDGTIVESGTHNELLSRGPQQSVYAAKWHAMTYE